MAIDKNTVSVAQAIRIATEYYDKEGLSHAMRVMQNVANNEIIPKEYEEDCLALAILHDLIEDTEFKPVYLPENFTKALKLLSKPKDMDYVEYIKNIRNTSCTDWRECAWWVKLADMKDHLSQTDTLTDRLKNKYLTALPYLL